MVILSIAMKMEQLAYILNDQQGRLEEDKQVCIDREKAEEVIGMLSLKMPIIITGVRRCGKSFLMYIVKTRLKLKERQFLYVDFNDERMSEFGVEDFQGIVDYMGSGGYEKGCLLLIDEIQETKNWEKWIDRIKGSYRIIITGSNSRMLSKEISTLLTGRSIGIELTPFSFKEFLDAKGVSKVGWKSRLEEKSRVKSLFAEFLEAGGFPKRVITGSSIVTSELFENILYRDVIGKLGKKMERPPKEAASFMLANAGRDISVRAVSEAIGVKNLLSTKQVIDTFEKAFIFFFVSKFDYSVRKQIQNPKKAYCIDNGFLTSVGFRFSEDRGRLLENFVAVELRRRGKEIYYSRERG